MFWSMQQVEQHWNWMSSRRSKKKGWKEEGTLTVLDSYLQITLWGKGVVCKVVSR